MNTYNTLHEKTFAVAWGDMDALGHVNNARYFDYFQEARIDWLKQLQIDMRSQEGPIIVQTACTFHKPVIYPATVSLRSHVMEIGNSSILMSHNLYQDDLLMAEGTCKIVWVDYRKGKSTSLPEAIRNVVTQAASG